MARNFSSSDSAPETANFTHIPRTEKPFAPGQENNYFPPFVVIVSGVPAADLLL
jgi:hypothetical protein